MAGTGCGRLTQVAGTNGGVMSCGASLRELTGVTNVVLCGVCRNPSDGPLAQGTPLTKQEAYAAAIAADNAFQHELERAYGKRGAADARYRYHHDDPAVEAAKTAKLIADNQYRAATS